MRKHKLGNQGQTTVEYMLLIFVVVTLLFTILQSRVVRNVLGTEGETIQTFKRIIERGHRHAFSGGEPSDTYGNFTGRHESFVDIETGETRFFVPTDPYPDN